MPKSIPSNLLSRVNRENSSRLAGFAFHFCRHSSEISTQRISKLWVCVFYSIRSHCFDCERVMQRAQFTRMWHSVATNFHACESQKNETHKRWALIHSHSAAGCIPARVQFGQIIQTIRRKNAQMCSCHPVPVGLVNRFLNCAVNTARTKNAQAMGKWACQDFFACVKFAAIEWTLSSKARLSHVRAQRYVTIFIQEWKLKVKLMLPEFPSCLLHKSGHARNQKSNSYTQLFL